MELMQAAPQSVSGQELPLLLVMLGESWNGSGTRNPHLGCDSHWWSGSQKSCIVPGSWCRSGGGC